MRVIECMFVFVCVFVCMCLCKFVCLCVRTRDKGSEGEEKRCLGHFLQFSQTLPRQLHFKMPSPLPIISLGIALSIY